MFNIKQLFKFKKVEEKKDNPKLEKIVKEYKNNNNFKAKEMLKLYNFAKPKNNFDIKGYKYKLINKYFPLSTILVNMELTNGHRIFFVVKIKDGGFRFDKGFYIVDDELKYYVPTSKLFALDYHEELCFPIKRNINISEIKDSVQNSDIELKTAINPISLDNFIQSNVIQKLLAGAELDKTLTFIKIMVIILALGTAINLLLSLSLANVI